MLYSTHTISIPKRVLYWSGDLINVGSVGSVLVALATSSFISYLHTDKVRPGDLTKSGSASPELPSFLPMNLPALHPPPTAVSTASFPPVPHCWGFPSSAVMCFLLASYRGLQRSLKHRQADTHVHAHTQPPQMPLFIKAVLQRTCEHMGRIINPFILN